MVKSGKARQQPLGGSMAYLNTLQQELSSTCPSQGVDCWANPGEGFFWGGWSCLVEVHDSVRQGVHSLSCASFGVSWGLS